MLRDHPEFGQIFNKFIEEAEKFRNS